MTALYDFVSVEYIVMFLSVAFDNPGRFVAMILLMLQLGGSGGTFPMEVTNHFYNVIHPFLPLTYSILSFRQAITSGLGDGTFEQAMGAVALVCSDCFGIAMVQYESIAKASFGKQVAIR